MHGTGAAGRHTATELGTGEPELLAQYPEQRRVRIGVGLEGLSVDVEVHDYSESADQAKRKPCRDKGIERMRRPVAAKIAFASAGATTTGLTSPTPPSAPPPSMNSTRMSGVSVRYGIS